MANMQLHRGGFAGLLLTSEGYLTTVPFWERDMDRHCHQRDLSARKRVSNAGYSEWRCSPEAVNHGGRIYSGDVEKSPSWRAVQNELVSGGTFRGRKSPLRVIYLFSRAFHSVSSSHPKKGSVNWLRSLFSREHTTHLAHIHSDTFWEGIPGFFNLFHISGKNCSRKSS